MSALAKVLGLPSSVIVNIRGRDKIVRHGYRVIPKAEIVYSVRAFGYGEEGFTVASFYTYH